MRPIWRHVPWLPGGALAMVVWPFILIRPEADSECIRRHELYHWRQMARWLVLPWYIAYGVLALRYWGQPAHRHPMERPAYLVEWECDGSLPARQRAGQI